MNSKLQFNYDPNNFEDVFGYAEYMRRLTSYLKENPDQMKLMCQVYDMQASDFPTPNNYIIENPSTARFGEYRRRVKSLEEDIIRHIEGNQDPFSI